jgi:hypothetical protein
MVSRPARASRAATLMSSLRMVAPRATACRGEASTPSARVRVWAMVANCSQAALAVSLPDGRCVRGPSSRSAKTCSMMAWPRWCDSAWVS